MGGGKRRSRSITVRRYNGFNCNRSIPNFAPALNAPDPGLSLGYWFSIAAQRYYTLMLDRMRHHDLDRWFYALLVIAEHDGKLSQQELAQAMQTDKVSMLRAIDLLSAKGYVERVNCPDDRRKHHIRLLPKALPVVKDIRRIYTQLNEQAFEGMGATQRKAFLHGMNGMLERLSSEGLRPARIKYTKKLPK
jgi:DNA-binding MarR family transcriptional regulator